MAFQLILIFCQKSLDKQIQMIIKKSLFIILINIIMHKDLDPTQEKLIEFYKSHDWEDWYTLREIATEIWANHPQTILNKLNQLVKKWYLIREGSWFRLVKDFIKDLFYLPVYWFAQCWHEWQNIINQYSQEKIPVTFWLLWTNDLNWCFFVRAKWDSMEPKIHDWDLVLIRQQEKYDIDNYVLIVHNDLAKLKKIKEKDNKKYLVSVNKNYDDVEIDEYDDTKIVWTIKRIISSL